MAAQKNTEPKMAHIYVYNVQNISDNTTPFSQQKFLLKSRQQERQVI
jgi:hypothetical protein